ncbi:hypothetical protein PMAYCL1PPCAC_31950, partial [Pristionchus mayeri]
SDDDTEPMEPADSEANSVDGKITMHFPDQYHILKISSENELFFYKFIPGELLVHVPQICAALTPDRESPRFFNISCLGSAETRGHYEQIECARRNGRLPQ